MAFTKQRFLINPLANAVNLTTLSQAAGTVANAKKTGTGSATLTPSGSYIGANDKLVTWQIDSLGTGEIGSSTYRWKTSDTAAGTWEATGQATTTATVALGSEGVEFTLAGGTGADFVLNDKFQWWVRAESGPGNLFINDRDLFWQSGSIESILVNGGFDSDTSSWTPAGCTLASIAGGQSGNCLELTATGGSNQFARQDFTTIAGAKYQFFGYVKSGTSGNESFEMRAYDVTGAATIDSVTGTSSGTWTQYSFTFTAPSTSTRIYLTKISATIGTMLFDTVSVQLIPVLSIDLGSAQLITAFVLGDHNLTASATLTLKSGASYSLAVTPIADPQVRYISKTYQPWQVEINDPTNTDGYIRIGKLYLGTYTEVASGEVTGGANWGPGRTVNRNEVRNEAATGKERARVYTENESFPLAYTWMSQTNLATLRSIWDYTSNTDTGENSSIWIHYWNDVESSMLLCKAIGNFSPTYVRGGSSITLNFRQEVMTRVL